MTDMIAAWVLSALGYLCTTSPADAVGDPGSSGPLLGNVAVAGGAGLISLVCIVAALHMLIHPGEGDPTHPKYRVLDNDR